MLSGVETTEKKYKCVLTDMCTANGQFYILEIVCDSRNEEIQEIPQHFRLLI